MIDYHDKQWGNPVHEDRKLFEFLLLDAFQAGLNWSIVWNKRSNFKEAFDNFNPKKIAKYDKKDFLRLLKNKEIIRNRAKITAAIINAQKFLDVKKEFGSFNRYIWQFTNHKTIHHKLKKMSQIPSKTVESEAMSKGLKKRGFKFVGPTICYAFMQAAGMVNDHTINCFRYKKLSKP